MYSTRRTFQPSRLISLPPISSITVQAAYLPSPTPPPLPPFLPPLLSPPPTVSHQPPPRLPVLSASSLRIPSPYPTGRQWRLLPRPLLCPVHKRQYESRCSGRRRDRPWRCTQAPRCRDLGPVLPPADQ